MPLTKAFVKLRKRVRLQYGKKKEGIAYAIANKQGIKIHLGRPAKSHSRGKFKINGR